MSYVLKTFDLEADFKAARDAALCIRMPKDDKFIKSYWLDMIRCKKEGLLHEDCSMILMTSEETGPAGFAIMNNARKMIDLIVVSESCQGRGIGSKLLKECISLGASSLEVHPDNMGAIKLYRRLGFKSRGASGPYVIMKISPLKNLKTVKRLLGRSK